MCCYINIASPASYLSVNIHVAKMFGLNTAVYWSAVSEILDRVKDKKTFDEFGFFKIDRKYITAKTTLTPKQQRDCDAILAESNIVLVDSTNSDRIRVDVGLMVSYIINSDATVLANVTPVVNKKAKSSTSKNTTKTSEEQKEAKLAGIKANMSRYIKVALSSELGQAYLNWLESTISARRVTGATVTKFQNDLDNYTTDISAKVEIINIAAAHSYIDAIYAIDLYQKQVTSGIQRVNSQKSTVSVDTSIAF